MLNKTKTLTTIARQKKGKEKALKSIQTGKEPYKNHSEERSLQNAKKNKKTTKKKSDRRRPSKKL